MDLLKVEYRTHLKELNYTINNEKKYIIADIVQNVLPWTTSWPCYFYSWNANKANYLFSSLLLRSLFTLFLYYSDNAIFLSQGVWPISKHHSTIHQVEKMLRNASAQVMKQDVDGFMFANKDYYRLIIFTLSWQILKQFVRHRTTDTSLILERCEYLSIIVYSLLQQGFSNWGLQRCTNGSEEKFREKQCINK